MHQFIDVCLFGCMRCGIWCLIGTLAEASSSPSGSLIDSLVHPTQRADPANTHPPALAPKPSGPEEMRAALECPPDAEEPAPAADMGGMGAAAAEAQVRAEALASEVAELAKERERQRAAARRTEEQGALLAASLGEADSHLARLRRILDEGLAGELAAQADAAGRALAGGRAELQRRTAELAEKSARDAGGEVQLLEEQVAEGGRSVKELEGQRQSQLVAGLEHRRELSALRLEGESLAAQLQLSQGRVAELSEGRERDLALCRRLTQAAAGVHGLAQERVAELGRGVAQLRVEARSGLTELWERWLDGSAQATQLADKAPSGASAQGHLQALVSAAAGDVATLEQELVRLHAEERASFSACAQAEEARRKRSEDVRRLESVVAASLPLARPDAATPDRHGDDPPSGIPRPLPEFEASLDEGLERVRASAAAVQGAKEEEWFEAEVEKALSSCAPVADSGEEGGAAAELESACDGVRRHLEALTARVAWLDCEAQSGAALIWTTLRRAEALKSKMAGCGDQEGPAVAPGPEAAEPARARLRDVLSELDALQQRFEEGLLEHDRACDARLAASTAEHRRKVHGLEADLRGEISKLRGDLAALQGQGTAAGTTEKRVADLVSRLGVSRGSLEASAAACQGLRGHLEAEGQDARR